MVTSEPGTRWTRLAPVAATVALVASLFGVDAYLGYRGMAHPNPDEAIQSVYAPHPRLGWAPVPGATGRHQSPGSFDVVYGIDADGLRRVPNRGAARRRVWAFGDSFTFGVGVEDDEAWPSVLAREWLAPDVHVMNAGVAAYGLPQELQRLVELQDRVQPGDLVLFTPISNDIERTLPEFAYLSRFLFGRMAKRRVEACPDLRDGELVTARLDTPSNRVKAILYHAKYTGASIRRIAHWLWPPHTAEDAHIIVELARGVAQRHGARFALLFLPTPEECGAGAYRVDVSPFDVPDLRSGFPRDPAELARIRFGRDGHWNARGHELAARAIVETLTRTGALAAEDLASPARGTGSPSGGRDDAVVP